MSKLVYSIRSFDLQHIYFVHSFKEWIAKLFKQLFKHIKTKMIHYLINLAEKVDTDTMRFKDFIFPFLLGCVIFQLTFIIFNI